MLCFFHYAMSLLLLFHYYAAVDFALRAFFEPHAMPMLLMPLPLLPLAIYSADAYAATILR